VSTRTLKSAFGWILCASAATAGAATEPVVLAAAPGYDDRLIDGGSLAADVSADDFAGHDPDGWPRAMFVEGITSRIDHGDTSLDESGARLGGMLDTPDYGAFTLDAIFRSSNDDENGSGSQFTLVQRDFPMNGGWRVNNALGVSNTPASDLARQQYRFFMPTIPMNGAATEWRQGDRLQIHASVGEPGLFAGIYLPTFEGLGGTQGGAGLQWNFTDDWSAAVQMIDMERVHTTLRNSSQELSSQSWFGALAWKTPDAMAQVNFVDSITDGESGEFAGWIDTAIRTGRTWHTMGAFYLDPDLIWGNQPLSSDSKGGYYRAAYQSRQWAMDGGVDYVASVSGQSDATVYGTGYARYQYSYDIGVGGGANIRHSDSEAWSTFGFADVSNRWGIGRGQLGYARSDTQDGTQLTLNQTWNTQAGRRLSTALSVGHENLDAYSSNTVGLAVYGGGDLTGTLSLDMSARWDTTFGDASADNWLANVALNYVLIPIYGPVGAAGATVISYSVASYGALFLHPRTRPAGWMMTRAMIAPIRYLFR